MEARDIRLAVHSPHTCSHTTLAVSHSHTHAHLTVWPGSDSSQFVSNPRFVCLRPQITDPKEHEPLYSSFANDRIFRDPLIRKEKPDVGHRPQSNLCTPAEPVHVTVSVCLLFMLVLFVSLGGICRSPLASPCADEASTAWA